MGCDCCEHSGPSAPVPQVEPPQPFTIHTSHLFDSQQLKIRTNVSIRVDPATSLITEVYERTSDLIEDGLKPGDIDLRGKFVLPGFVDAHTHIFLHAYSENPSVNQKRDESFVERVVRSMNHCKAGLMAGYTTYRDLGSEGMADADCNVRDAINRGLAVGPRLFVSTKVLASTTSYEPRTENYFGGTRIPSSSEWADGEAEIRKAVRKRIGAGADVIKFYADYRRRLLRAPPKQQHPYIPGIKFPNLNDNPDYLVYTEDEMRIIVEEATMAGAPAVAHAKLKEAVLKAVRVGAISIEHGFEADEECFAEMKKRGTLLVPTLAIAEKVHTPEQWKRTKAWVKVAYDHGVKLACGGDTGTFSHGDNAREMEIMIEAGIPVLEVLAAGTIRGWESCGGLQCGKRFGIIAENYCADIVALNSDPTQDMAALRQVDFVMKDGQVFKTDGKIVI